MWPRKQSNGMRGVKITAPSCRNNPEYRELWKHGQRPHSVTVWCLDRRHEINLVYKKAGRGERAFLVCPVCGAARRRLWDLSGVVCCRAEIPERELYADAKNITRYGHDWIGHKMKSIAGRYNITVDYGTLFFHWRDYFRADKRPPGIGRKRYADIIARLAMLDLQRVDLILQIHGRKTLDAAELDRVKRICRMQSLKDDDFYNLIMVSAMQIYGIH